MAQAIFRAKPFPVYTPTFIKTSLFHTNLPAYEDGTECSETSAYKIQKPGNYPEESIQEALLFAPARFILHSHIYLCTAIHITEVKRT
jgi:hypothetical protein